MNPHADYEDYLLRLEQAPSCLSMQRVNESTLLAYQKAIGEFLFFCRARELTAYSRMRVDDALADFGNHLYGVCARRGQRQLFINAVMGAELIVPHLKGYLLRSRAVYAGWDKVTPGSSPPPVPVALLAVIVLHFREKGYRSAGLGILLAFHALLRIQELLRLTWADVLLPGDCRLPHSSRTNGTGGVLIRVAKTGVLQFVPISDGQLLSLLRKYKPQHETNTKVVNLSASELRRLYKSALCHAGCSKMGYVFHSLRHGGATNMYLHGCEVSTIQAAGRWKQVKTCSVYVQAGRGLLLGTKFSNETLVSMDQAVRRLRRLQDY